MWRHEIRLETVAVGWTCCRLGLSEYALETLEVGWTCCRLGLSEYALETMAVGWTCCRLGLSEYALKTVAVGWICCRLGLRTLEAFTSTLRTYSAFGFRHTTAHFISAKQLNATDKHVILSSSQKSWGWGLWHAMPADMDAIRQGFNFFDCY